MRKLLSKLKVDWSDFIMEVISIFLGVTVAIIVNNWSENAKNTHQEATIFQNLEVDLNNEIAEIEIVLASINYRDSLNNEYRDGIIDKELTNVQIREYIKGISFYRTYEASHATYEILKASDNLSKISNPDFLKELITHYSFENQIQTTDERYEKAISGIYDKYVVENIDVRDFLKNDTIRTNFVILLDDIKFTNILIALSKFNTDRKLIYSYFLDQKKTLLKSLKNK